MPIIMVVDSEPLARKMLEEQLDQMGHTFIGLKNGQEALDYLLWNASPAPDVLLLDMSMPGMDGLTVIRALRNTHASLPIIALNAPDMSKHSLQAVKAGAYDFITKPICSERLEVAIVNAIRNKKMQQELELLKPSPQLCLNPESYTGYSESWLKVICHAAEEARHNGSLILEGEDGIGKMTLAHAIHANSMRKHKPFIIADTEQDIDSLHAMLSSASGGTLAVRHNGRIPKEFLLGLEKLYKILSQEDIRLVLCVKTSPENLATETVDRFFNQNRLKTIKLPPLRERKEDISLLMVPFIRKAAALLGKAPPAVPAALIQKLVEYPWPGNIRQLYTELFTSIQHSHSQLRLPLCCLDTASSMHMENSTKPFFISLVDREGNLRSLEEIESEVIHYALNNYKTSRSDIARMLGIGRTTLYRKAHQLVS